MKATKGQKADAAPRLSEWSPEVALLAALRDAVVGVRDTLVAVNSPKGRAPRSEPYPRPRTAFDRVRFEERQKAHERLAARVLPGRR